MATGADPSTSSAASSLPSDTGASSSRPGDGSPGSSTGSSSTVEPTGCECGPRTGTTPTKKRKRNVDNWQQTKRKQLRNSRKEYLSVNKKKVGITCKLCACMRMFTHITHSMCVHD